ncbi:hypothetical protein NI17_017055 [Thermobifida halotolerans]|uniref:Uncharacterized protein n=1 Tax=Thermobifida halotolerans TaxID=483545 RepID=A0AA97M2V1_9ACTN|nr:hypothetical protein [Thermobifida halotolerans]UOE18518.1 hypothetical protein NI17_017055 [Thermobifida halotolerans]
MRASVRNTTFAALATAGLFAVALPAHAETVSDDRGPVVGKNEWEPLLENPFHVCGDSIAVLRRSTVCATGASPAGTGAEQQPAPTAEGEEAPDRCGADEHCALQKPEEDTAAEQPDAPAGEDAPARSEPPLAGEPEQVAADDGRQPSHEGDARSFEQWGAASGVPDIAPPLGLGTPGEEEPARPETLESATYALTSSGTEDAPLLTAAVATLLLGGVAIYAGYGLGRSDRPNLFR